MTYYEHEVIRDRNLSGTPLYSSEFVDCTFENCVFENLHIIDCKFIDCAFLKCRITNPTFEHCTMTGSDFTECRLFGVNWGGLASGFIAPIDHLQNCQLKFNNFVNNNYPKFLFSDNDITESLFADCNLSRSKFCRCHLTKTEFFRCDLTGATFENAESYVVDISTCKLKGAVFSFPEVVNLLGGLGIVIK